MSSAAKKKPDEDEDIFPRNAKQNKLIKHNVLLKALKNYKHDKIPMTDKNICTIIENAMEEKYKYDSSNTYILSNIYRV